MFGSFIEKDVKGAHTYVPNDEGENTASWDFPHKLLTNDGFRYARVLKTVAYIAVDEDAYGQPIVEKWDIYSHRQMA
jgi:hypothetical protein